MVRRYRTTTPATIAMAIQRSTSRLISDPLVGRASAHRLLSAHNARAVRRAPHPAFIHKEAHMPKGQQRSNKEAKKPKQQKKVPVPSSSVVPPARSVPAPGKKR